ncbi:uncharacterized protein LOC124794785 isoform X1 [Schistocerca piceifrons]|uniref:uncharacterized protein LOC124794785 isoform X1 n=3 Tax=Schistocerca piceifrons TaxID=274613 RepID=UPI001F5EC25B|nr:uncharacterized protein LOC124794785 isoform X1 [Schistocerca piceifrons]XP_047114384.1 uncharacterized protein LOC124794785 isoform X1 [Schistocerca piceifrons]XP_047114385.1 uncharacterized protein LOC124794785 isoform X1 [Schistocerca piceifrons]XP_047114386.1 uncharacterized protein LOC124794785 isoform X1 [Schistocerca piceifrons]
MYVKSTYIPVRRRKRRKRFPAAIIEDDLNSSFYLFNALNADSIKKFKADQKCNPKKKRKPKKLQNSVHFDTTTVDLKAEKENRKKSKMKGTMRKEGVAAAKKYKFFQPEVKVFSDVTQSPNTTFDRLLRSSRKPLVDKNSSSGVKHQVEHIDSVLLSPSHCLPIDKGSNRTSTPILISPVFPAVSVCNKRRNNNNDLKRDGRNMLTQELRNSIENIEKSSLHHSSIFAASDSTFSPSLLLCDADDTDGSSVVRFFESRAHISECLRNKVEQCKCVDSPFSQIAKMTRNSIENENIDYKITHQDSSGNISRMRLRRTTTSENEGPNNTDNSFNPDESFYSSIKIKHKRNKKTKNGRDKVDNTRNSDDFLSPIFTRSKRTRESQGVREKAIGVQEFISVHDSNKRSGSDSVYNKGKSNCNIDESIPSSVRIKHKRIENRYQTRSSHQHRERYLVPLVSGSQHNESGSNGDSTTWDRPEIGQLQFAMTCESPDMFSSVDEIETDMVAFKCGTVVQKNHLNFSDESASSRNLSSVSVITNNSHEYHRSLTSNDAHSFNVHVRKAEFSHSVSSVEVRGNSEVDRKSIGNINLSSQVSNTLDLTSPVHAGLSDLIITSVQNSDCDNVVNEVCANRSKSLEAEFDNGGCFRATAIKNLMPVDPEVNQCSRTTQKSARSSSDAAVLSPSHIETCIPSYKDMCTTNMLSQATHQEEESENVSDVLYQAAVSHELSYCKGQNLVHSTSLYCGKDAELSYRNSSRRSSLCRRLSHVVIPERRTRGSNNSNGSLPVSDKRSVPLSDFTVSVIIEEDEDELAREVAAQGLDSARDMVLGRCNQLEPLSFEKAFPPRFFDNCKKIGEGLYGEVFFCQYNCTSDRVLKIIPIEGHILVNGEKQKKYEEVLSELVIAMELSNLRHDAQFKTSCFVEVARCVCVQGKYPQRLIDLWNEYHEEKVSENDSPTIFDDSQLFLIFELADGGKALESYCFTSAAQAFSAFVQLSFALAVAEITLEFEHRDLHWGNVLIKKTSAKHITFKLSGKEFSVPSNGIQVTVIDYTLSRMSYGGCFIFNDLAVDPDLFISQGDYQFEVYRLMQNTVKNEWRNFRPYTNILWLHYTLGKMLQGVNYKNISTKIHKKFRTKLANCYNDVLKYNSAHDLVTSGNLLEMIK